MNKEKESLSKSQLVERLKHLVTDKRHLSQNEVLELSPKKLMALTLINQSFKAYRKNRLGYNKDKMLDYWARMQVEQKTEIAAMAERYF